MNVPLISVIIPIYNSEKYIKYALESIFNQNNSNIEVIVVNDGSTDNSIKIIEQFKKNIKVISQDNKGPATARNLGINESKGSIIGFLDSDDLWSNSHIKDMLEYLLNDNNYQVIRGKTAFFKNNVLNNSENTSNGLNITQVILSPHLIGSALYKKDIFNKVGLFDESMRYGEDIDWSNRFNLYNDIKEKRIEPITLYYRKHDNNMTNLLESTKKGMFNVIRKNIQRKK